MTHSVQVKGILSGGMQSYRDAGYPLSNITRIDLVYLYAICTVYIYTNQEKCINYICNP